jgi:hypothetical protein
MRNRERLLRAADAIKVAENPFAEILSAALWVRHRLETRLEKIGRIVSYPTNRFLSNNKRK